MNWYFESQSFCATGALRNAVSEATQLFDTYLSGWDELLEDNERLEIVSTFTNFIGEADYGSFVITVVVKKITLNEQKVQQ